MECRVYPYKFFVLIHGIEILLLPEDMVYLFHVSNFILFNDFDSELVVENLPLRQRLVLIY